VKYADGPTTEVEAEVDAPVERVWALVTDIDLPARFSSEFQGARWLDGGPALGARFVGRNQHPAAGTWETTCVVTVCTPHRTFEWAVGDPDFPSARWRFDLEPQAGGGTRLRQWMQMGPAPSGLTPAIEAMPDKEERIVARRLEEHRANMGATLAGIKELAESEP
jgi:uncharacterized protein YndB with AHSA1/START domain